MIIVRFDFGATQRPRLYVQSVSVLRDVRATFPQLCVQGLNPLAFLKTKSPEVNERFRDIRERSKRNRRHDAVAKILLS
jgi:hypothetical protein